MRNSQSLKMVKKLFLVFALATTSFAAPAIWDGTADISWYTNGAQAYNLTTAEQLAGLAQLVNDGTSSFEGKTITLGADIFLNDTTGVGAGTWASIAHREWIPIGTSTQPFKGEFDGLAGRKNRKIYGLYINTTKNCQGLFGYTSGVKVSNLDLLAGKVSAGDSVGALIGFSTGGGISNIFSEVGVKGGNYTGGLLGNSSGTITKSYFVGNVYGKSYVGGLAGSSGAISGTAAAQSFVKGNVTGNGYVGGVVGQGSSVTNSYSEGTITGTANYVGGVVGYASGFLSSVYHVGGDVSGMNYVGGVVGGSSSNVSNSYSEGSVAGDSLVGGVGGSISNSISSAYHIGGNVSGKSHVGGVAGYAKSSMYNSYKKDGTVSGTKFVGGLIGLSYYNFESRSTSTIINTVYNSYAEADVIGEDYVGGLVGKDSLAYTEPANEFAKNKRIAKSHSVGRVSGSSYVGGIVGHSKGLKSINMYASIDSCYHIDGDIIGLKSYVGGVAGYIDGPIDSAYHISGDVRGIAYVGGVAGKVDSNVTKSYSEGTITGTSLYIGGVAGYASGFLSSVYHVGGDVSGTSYVGGVVGETKGLIDSAYHVGGNVTGGSYVGGVVGRGSSVTNSYSEGTITGNTNYIGGIVGYTSGSLNSVHHVGGDVSGQGYVGGVVGYAKSSVKNSYSEGSVAGDSLVGGVAGYVTGLYNSKVLTTRKVGYVENPGSLECVYHKNGDVKGLNYVGGVVGYTRGSLDSVYHVGGDVSGKNHIGGVIGYAASSLGKLNTSSYSTYTRYSIEHSKQNINQSYFKGNVKGSGLYIGGIAGRLENDYGVENCNSEGRVSGQDYVGGLVGSIEGIVDSSKYLGNVEGAMFVGGVVGEAHGFIYEICTTTQGCGGKYDSRRNFSSIIKESHSRGDVNGGAYVGGVVGHTNDLLLSVHHADGDVIGKYYVGGVAGCDSSSIKNSYSKGGVKGDSSYVGGVVGYANGSLEFVYHIGDVNGGGYVGGVVGKGYSVRNSYSESSVTGTANYVGGVVGYASGFLSSVYHVGGDLTGLDYVGGVVGYAASNMINANSEGFVKGQNSVGGLAGYVSGNVKNSYFTGDSVIGIFEVGGLAGSVGGVVDSSYSIAFVKGDDNVGGLIGSSKDNVSNSYATGDVLGDIENSSAGNDNIGGLIGYAYGGSISKSFALGNVEGTTKVGGLIGRFEGSSIMDAYATGNIKGRYEGDPADQNGNLYIGGLVGVGKGTFENTYSSGTVVGDENDPLYTGCLVGAANARMTIKNSYYDATVCSKLSVTGDEDGYVTISGTPAQNTIAMKMQSTFADWDFVDTWKIMDDSYPFLKFFANSLNNAVVTTASLDGFVYDGSAKTPLVTSVILFDELLTYGSDYTITYSNNVNAGIASIDVCGVGSYGGCKKIDFEIAAAAIKPVIADIEDTVYNGKPHFPKVSVYNGETLLAENEYDVFYSSNLNAGVASVEATIKGNYTGSATKTFVIKKAIPVILIKPIAENIAEGSVLKNSELTGGKVEVEGSFEWVSPETIVKSGDESFEVRFVPADVDNYQNTGKFTVPIKVLVGFEVVFANTDGIELQSNKVIEGEMPEYKGDPPKKTASAQYSYTFAGWSPELTNVVENVTYMAKYDSTLRTYTITFKDGNTVLEEKSVSYGNEPVYSGKIPSRDSTEKYAYNFIGWDSEISAVTEAMTYVAVFDSVLRTYTITFKDGNTVLEEKSVSYGNDPIYSGKTPSRDSTAKFSYKFVGWDSEFSKVTEAKAYTAVFDSVIRSYSVVFRKGSEELQKEILPYGSNPVYSGISLEQESTAKYDYAFKGWDPEVSAVNGDVIYNAIIDSTLRTYTITFKDGTKLLQTKSVAYGVVPSYSGTPSRVSSEKYTYSFKNWNPNLVAVSENTSYNAVFDSTLRSYTIYFKSGYTTLQSSQVSYGSKPIYSGVIPTKTSSAKYDYRFKGWDNELAAVSGSKTYNAIFDSTIRTYNIVFVNGNDTLQHSKVAYGSIPSYIGKTVVKEPSLNYKYSFKQWTPAISSVTADKKYVAVFDSTARKYTVIFAMDSVILQTRSYSANIKPVYLGANPSKSASKGYMYSFIGWTPEIVKTGVTDTVTYHALFDSTARTYSVRFVNGNEILQSTMVAYGEKPVYVGNTPTKTPSTAFSYEFVGWDTEISQVTGSKTYAAVFDSIAVSEIISTNICPQFSIGVVGRMVQISAQIGKSYTILDLQGKILKSGIVSSRSFEVNMPNSGRFLIHIGDQIRLINIK